MNGKTDNRGIATNSWLVHVVYVAAFGLCAFNFGRYADLVLLGVADNSDLFGFAAGAFGTVVFGWVLFRRLGEVGK